LGHCFLPSSVLGFPTRACFLDRRAHLFNPQVYVLLIVDFPLLFPPLQSDASSPPLDSSLVFVAKVRGRFPFCGSSPLPVLRMYQLPFSSIALSEKRSPEVIFVIRFRESERRILSSSGFFRCILLSLVTLQLQMFFLCFIFDPVTHFPRAECPPLLRRFLLAQIPIAFQLSRFLRGRIQEPSVLFTFSPELFVEL